MNPLLKLDRISFAHPHPRLEVLRDFSLDLAEGERLSVVGPSGCGKSTLLSLILGLRRPDQGRITFRGEPVTAPSRQRMIVFQNFALYPWLTCLGNVLFSIETASPKPAQPEKLALRYLEQVGLAQFADHYPRQLSGGMQQRVGIARALAADPELLLLDEPFSSVDPLLRRRLFADVLALVQTSKKTAVLVTHDLDEARRFGHRTVVLGTRSARVRTSAQLEEGDIYAHLQI